MWLTYAEFTVPAGNTTKGCHHTLANLMSRTTAPVATFTLNGCVECHFIYMAQAASLNYQPKALASDYPEVRLNTFEAKVITTYNIYAIVLYLSCYSTLRKIA